MSCSFGQSVGSIESRCVVRFLSLQCNSIPMLTYHQGRFVVFTWQQFYRKHSSHLFMELVWRLYFWKLQQHLPGVKGLEWRSTLSLNQSVILSCFRVRTMCCATSSASLWTPLCLSSRWTTWTSWRRKISGWSPSVRRPKRWDIQAC